MCLDDAAVELVRGDVRVTVAPHAGGRIARLSVGDGDLLLRPGAASRPLAWGCYPMVPWAGRIRDGRFEFRGRIVDLPRTLGGHAIHGVGFTSSWSVTGRSPTAVHLSLDLPADLRWPFGGHAEQVITVAGDGVSMELSVTATERPFPASLGWHPWFVKPDRLEFRPSAMYRRDEHHVAVDELIEVPAGPWDDCFVNTEPIALSVAGVEIDLTSDCSHWVVYDELATATCVEPQTGPPDAPNIRPHVLEPGETLAARFDVSVRAPDPPGAR